MLHCHYLPVAYDTIVELFPEWDKGVLGIQRLIDGDPTSSLQTPISVMAWTAVYASWKTRYAFCSDSSDAILGVGGAAKRWKLRGWKGSCGLVANVSIWELLLDELNQLGKTVKWIKISSHVSVEGNKEADRLADLGRPSSPLNPVLSTNPLVSPNM